jgi:hypothetical protein
MSPGIWRQSEDSQQREHLVSGSARRTVGSESSERVRAWRCAEYGHPRWDCKSLCAWGFAFSIGENYLKVLSELMHARCTIQRSLIFFRYDSPGQMCEEACLRGALQAPWLATVVYEDRRRWGSSFSAESADFLIEEPWTTMVVDGAKSRRRLDA